MRLSVFELPVHPRLQPAAADSSMMRGIDLRDWNCSSHMDKSTCMTEVKAEWCHKASLCDHGFMSNKDYIEN